MAHHHSGARWSRIVRSAAAAVAALAVGLGGAGAAEAVGPASPHPTCTTTRPGHAGCLSTWRAPVSGAGRRAAGAAATKPAGFGPADLRAAYRLPATGKANQTVAVVLAYDYPRAQSDLAVYRKTFGLPPCTSGNGCFRKVNQRGGAAFPPSDAGWATESALDLAMVSAACPGCRLLLVEADDSALDNLGTAVSTAVRLGADVVSNSYGADEFAGTSSYGSRYYRHPGTAIVASSGDWGFGTASFPAVLPYVTAVGGTSLRRSGSSWSETVWEGAGSGCSAYVAKPWFQKDAHCPGRTVADLSAVADPQTGVAVYDTFGLGSDGGWLVFGGTSVSSPLVAGMIGLKGTGRSYRDPARFYRATTGRYDITQGRNALLMDCGTDYLCNGKPGYDGPTGVGSPRGLAMF